MAFRVEITAQAEQDGTAILDWLISQNAGDTGIRWFRGLEQAIASLAIFPRRCGFAPENVAFPFELRQLLFGRKPHVYRILFTIDGDTVYILHIRHGQRKPLAGSESL